MNILVIGRTIPNERDSWGLFEFQQASALREAGHDVVYGYADNRSPLTNHTCQSIDKWCDGMHIIGSTLPSGFKLAPLFENLRTNLHLTMLSKLVDDKSPFW